jgi:hypothetical protein
MSHRYNIQHTKLETHGDYHGEAQLQSLQLCWKCLYSGNPHDPRMVGILNFGIKMCMYIKCDEIGSNQELGYKVTIDDWVLDNNKVTQQTNGAVAE